MKNMTKDKLNFASYDFSNSGFVIIFQSFLFPMLLASVLGAERNNYNIWPWLVTFSSICAIISAPFIGKFADKVGKWKIFAVLVIVAGILSSFTSIGLSTSLIGLSIGFIIFNTIFELSQSLYDSFLVNYEKTRKGITYLSTFAWGFGYLGGAIFAAVYFLLMKLDVRQNIMLFCFGIMYLILSLPSIFGFRKIESSSHVPTMESFNWGSILKPKNPVPWNHIFIYWIIADCVAAILYFVPIYLKMEIGLNMNTIGILILCGQLMAFPLTIFMGRIASRIGEIRAIQWSLVIWFGSLIGLYFSKQLLDIIPIIFALSFVIGSTQAILRAHFAARINEQSSGEGLGFYAIAQKSASVISPAIVGIVTLVSGSLRLSFIALAILIIIGIVLAPNLNKEKSL